MYSVTHSKREKEDLFATNNDHGLFRIRLGKRSFKIIYRVRSIRILCSKKSPLKSGNVVFLPILRIERGFWTKTRY